MNGKESKSRLLGLWVSGILDDKKTRRRDTIGIEQILSSLQRPYGASGIKVT